MVRLEHTLARAVRTPFAVILTQPRYSIARRYQLILPLLPDNGARIAPAVLRLPPRDWMQVFARSGTSVLAPIPLVHSIWHTRDIERETPYVLDEASLDQIDRRLCEFFSLVPPSAEG